MQWWVWLVAAVALLVVEMLTPGGFYFFFFGVGALATALAALAGVENLVTQSIIFLTLSIAAVLLFRKPLLRRFQPVVPSTRVDSLIGETATLANALHPGEFGQAELRGSSWTVRNISGTPIEAGQRCIVEQVDGLTLYIRAAE
ncbi:MAG: NfeD family protein [Acidobacteria bacterium]|nr:NfeD family protein [Acidobacteriota bacterium]